LALLLAAVSVQVGASAWSRGSRGAVNVDIAYTAEADAEQRLDIYTPSPIGLPPGALRPVVVYVHGGAWITGDKALDSESIGAYIDQGVLLVSVNYRLGPDHRYPANLADILAAADWIEANIDDYGGDPDNMVIVGHSAGAHLVSLAWVGSETLNDERLAARFNAGFSVDTAAYDLTDQSSAVREPIVNQAIRWTFGRNDDTLRAASPLYQVEGSPTYNPLHLFVTDRRPDVVTETARFADRLQDVLQPVETVTIEGATHSEMNDLIFTPESPIHQAVMAALD
jgi:acetyl esterase/lipase